MGTVVGPHGDMDILSIEPEVWIGSQHAARRLLAVVSVREP